MLPRELRLKESRRFQAVYRRGRSWANGEIVVYTLPRPTPEKQFGFAVGKKVGGAVQRNRVRRLLREACRELAPDVPPGVDVVIVGRPAAAGRTLAELKAGMRSLFQRAGLCGRDREPGVRYQSPGGRPRSHPARPAGEPAGKPAA